MRKIVVMIGLIISIFLVGCTPEQSKNETGVNQTMSNEDLVVEWAPLYTKNGDTLVDVNSKEYQTMLYNTKNIMFSDIKSESTVTLTTNGGVYIGGENAEGPFYLLTLLTNRTDKKITNLQYKIKVVSNADGTILGESGFDIPSNVYGEYVEPNIGYAALLPFPDNTFRTSGKVYLKEEITVYQEITYDTVED
ncbi:hypothetical protein HB943_12930 [Listeria weihenstephanensis]|uniref:Lipoprotein n=1 Tax=Listeria weihenstephanensis TaxID=1006155 RepID=A0A841Z8H2_9LIST|nr:hypothetical protein [Listeria weihenstephanensis]MBC1501510.1 hypothetical protein [Listeria weihenstephanensis]